MHKIHLFNLRKKEDSDFYYPIITKWWEDWKWDCPVMIKSLPETGVMISNNGIFICCGFLYRTDSKICIIGWIISSRDKKYRQLRKDSIELLIITLEELGKKMGFISVFMPAKDLSLIKRLEKHGYNKDKADLNMTNFIKDI